MKSIQRIQQYKKGDHDENINESENWLNWHTFSNEEFEIYKNALITGEMEQGNLQF